MLHNILHILGLVVSAVYLWRKPKSIYEISPVRILHTLLLDMAAILIAGILYSLLEELLGIPGIKVQDLQLATVVLSLGIKSLSLLWIEGVTVRLGGYAISPQMLFFAAHILYIPIRGYSPTYSLVLLIPESSALLVTDNYAEVLLSRLLILLSGWIWL